MEQQIPKAVSNEEANKPREKKTSKKEGKAAKAGQPAGETEYFDAANAVVGRVAALAVKLLLAGKSVVIVNSEKAVISGDPKGVAERYKRKRGIQNKANPENSPKWPRRPDFLYKKIVSGMVPDRPRGRAAFKRLRIFVGVPPELQGKQFRQYAVKSGFAKSITLGELCNALGAKNF